MKFRTIAHLRWKKKLYVNLWISQAFSIHLASTPLSLTLTYRDTINWMNTIHIFCEWIDQKQQFFIVSYLHFGYWRFSSREKSWNYIFQA